MGQSKLIYCFKYSLHVKWPFYDWFCMQNTLNVKMFKEFRNLMSYFLKNEINKLFTNKICTLGYLELLIPFNGFVFFTWYSLPFYNSYTPISFSRVVNITDPSFSIIYQISRQIFLISHILIYCLLFNDFCIVFRVKFRRRTQTVDLTRWSGIRWWTRTTTGSWR